MVLRVLKRKVRLELDLERLELGSGELGLQLQRHPLTFGEALVQLLHVHERHHGAVHQGVQGCPLGHEEDDGLSQRRPRQRLHPGGSLDQHVRHFVHHVDGEEPQQMQREMLRKGCTVDGKAARQLEDDGRERAPEVPLGQRPEEGLLPWKRRALGGVHAVGRRGEREADRGPDAERDGERSDGRAVTGSAAPGRAPGSPPPIPAASTRSARRPAPFRARSGCRPAAVPNHDRLPDHDEQPDQDEADAERDEHRPWGGRDSFDEPLPYRVNEVGVGRLAAALADRGRDLCPDDRRRASRRGSGCPRRCWSSTRQGCSGSRRPRSRSGGRERVQIARPALGQARRFPRRTRRDPARARPPSPAAPA